MIRMPQRSVTRFFIPLIDVLTLLFCIFLLLPMVKSADETTEEEHRKRDAELQQLRHEINEILKAGKDLPKEKLEKLDALRKATGKALQERVLVRVLEIDPANGHLFYRNPKKIEVSDQAAARDLVERDRREQGEGKRELYYLILYPRDPDNPYPLEGQKEQYTRWFEGVALGYDIPGK
jgi:hypothetical protein